MRRSNCILCTCMGGIDITVIISVLAALLVFGALILVHELGHYSAARIFGVGISEFSVGMGPKLISRTSRKSGTAYSLRLLPIGGFVSMKGEDDSSPDPDALINKPRWQRLIIMLAGSAMNLLVGIILVAVLVCTAKNLGSTTVHSFSDTAVSESGGLREGDRIVRVGGIRVHVLTDLAYAIMDKGYQPVDVTVDRDGERIVLEDVSFPVSESNGMTIGNIDFKVYAEQKTLPAILKHTFFQSFSYVRMVWGSIYDLVTGRYGLEQISGPVGITEQIGAAAHKSSVDFNYLCAVIAINLGVVNLLPLPALDGGRAFILLLSMLRGKDIDPEIEGKIHLVGLVLLMLLMVFVTVGDIRKLF